MASPRAPLVLASASPRRKALLEQLGLRFEVRPADVDETIGHLEGAGQFVQRLADEKARAVARTLDEGWVVGADTVGLLDGEILGKPDDARAAADILVRLSARTHTVLTGVSVVRCGDGTPLRDTDEGGVRAWTGIEETRVRMHDLPKETIRAYVATKEPLDKAGAYAIQGRAEPFVKSIEGTWSNVVGLPTGLTVRLLEKAGYPLPRRLHLRPAKDPLPASEVGGP